LEINRERKEMNIDLNQTFSVTKLGSLQLTGAKTALLSDELQMLVLLSGPMQLRKLGSLLAGSADRPLADTAGALWERGLILPVEDCAGKDDGSIDFYAPDLALDPHSRAIETEKSELTKARAELKRRGFYVSIARRAARKVRPVNGSSYHVLLIEDDPLLARMYGHLLAMMGCQTSTAGNRSEIEASVTGRLRPDLVLLDLNLPDIDGFDALDWLSRHERLGCTPVLVASADTSREAIVRAIALGADGYITKPIVVDSFIDSIRAILGMPAIDRSREGAWSSVVS